MQPLPAGREASPGVGAPMYERHRPEPTLLYQLVETYYPALKAHLAARGRALPGYVEREFEGFLKCGCLEHGFLRVRCDSCHAECLVAFSWPLSRIPALRGISALSLHVIAKLAALVPKPRVNLTRFLGVFAPNSKHRIQVTPG
jgi:hypothetical protein